MIHGFQHILPLSHSNTFRPCWRGFGTRFGCTTLVTLLLFSRDIRRKSWHRGANDMVWLELIQLPCSLLIQELFSGRVSVAAFAVFICLNGFDVLFLHFVVF